MDWSDRIARRLKLRDLHILMTVADTGSMAKAAARLRISHPAVSKAISEIEGTLRVRLFDRNSQGVELTAHGEVLLRCGINVFDEMQQGLHSLEHLSDPNTGEVRLGCTDIILHMKSDASEYLEPVRLETVIRKWADHITLPITVTQDGKDQPANEGTAREPRHFSLPGDLE